MKLYLAREQKIRHEEHKWMLPNEDKTARDTGLDTTRTIRTTRTLGVCLDRDTTINIARQRSGVEMTDFTHDIRGNNLFVYSNEAEEVRVGVYEMPVVGEYEDEDDFDALHVVTFCYDYVEDRDDEGFTLSVFFVDGAYLDEHEAENAVRREFIFAGGETPEPICDWAHGDSKRADRRCTTYRGYVSKDGETIFLTGYITTWNFLYGDTKGGE